MSKTPTAAKAARDIRALLLALQRARSAIAESLSEDKVEISKEVLPWIMGRNGDALLKTLDRMLQHYEETGTVRGSEYFNLVLTVNHIQPALRMFLVSFAEYTEFPKEVSIMVSMVTLT